MITPAPKKKCCTAKCCGIATLITIPSVALFLFIMYINIPNFPIPGANLEASRTYKPVLIYCERTVKDPVKYTDVWGKYSNYTYAKTPGCRAMFSFMSKDVENRALQLFFYDDAAAFFSQPQDKPELSKNLWAEYDGTKETDFCKVYGGFTADMKQAASALPGVHYTFSKPLGGFIRPPTADAYKMDGPPMFWISKREMREGQLEAYGTGFKHIADMMWPAAPGLVGTVEFADDQEANMVYSVRIFNDLTSGVYAHALGSPFIFPTIALTALPKYKSMIYPLANCFSTGGMIAATIAVLPQNAVYAQYKYEDGLLGPAPNFGKGL